MKILETEHEKKSFVLTLILFVVLFLLLLFMKLSSESTSDEIESGGGGEIAINFGNSDVGSGRNYQSREIAVSKIKAIPVQSIAAVEKVLTQEVEDAPAIASTPSVQKISTSKPVVKEIPKPSKAATDALSSIVNSSNKTGDGNDPKAGNKGKLNGDLNSKAYDGAGTGKGRGNGNGNGLGNGSGYGSGTGSGTGTGNYQLGNRKAINKPAPRYICDEQGTVVVQIAVDQSGKVISANPGLKGTTNTAKCLLDQARIAAMNTKWQSDPTAPDRQIGEIIYNFALTQ